MNLAILTDDGTTITEAVFRLTDTLQWWTPIFLTCELSFRFVELRVTNELAHNMQNPSYIIQNFFQNMFAIFSDIAVFVADNYYSDYMSMWFWIGDLVYLIFVM